MKNKFILTLSFVCIFMLWSCQPSREDILERNDKPLANEYRGYQEVNEKYKSQDFEVKILYKTLINTSLSPSPIRVFNSVNGNFIVSCDAQKNDETQGNMDYIKIDSIGNVMDKFELTNGGDWPEFINEFMVFTDGDKAYFNTWPINGDTTKRDFTVLNADLKWTGQKIKQIIETTQKEQAYWFFKDVYRDENSYRQFHFYQNKQWQLLWMKWPENQSVNDEESPTRYRKNIFWTDRDDPYLEENVHFFYFYKMEKVNYIHAIGGGSQSFGVENWRGKAFFDTKIGGKDFNFFVPNIAIENEKFDGNRNRFYKVDNPGYSVVNFSPSVYISPTGFAFYSSAGDEIYLIKAKKRA